MTTYGGSSAPAEVLPIGATSREEVEVLLSLDWIERVDRDWPGDLVMTVSEVALSTADPPGVISGQAAARLAGALADTRPKTAAVVLRSVMGEAHHVDETLVAFVRKGAKSRREGFISSSECRLLRGFVRPCRRCL